MTGPAARKVYSRVLLSSQVLDERPNSALDVKVYEYILLTIRSSAAVGAIPSTKELW
jgi:hypothetical protein